MRILFCVTHIGLLRHYGSVLQELADRGHSVHVASEDFGRGLSADVEADSIPGAITGITYGDVPARERTALSVWRYWLHMIMDWIRYYHPRFEHAVALRSRVEQQVPTWIVSIFSAIRRIDPHYRMTVRILRALDRATPPSRVIQQFIAEARPDLVMVSPYVYIGFEQADHVKAAQALGIPTAVCIASWDNLTNKGIISTTPDRLFIWNEAQREEAVTLHDVPADRVVVTGAQLFDRWFDRRPSRSREEFCRTAGLDPARPYILYTGSSDFIAPQEAAFVRRWVRLVRSSPDPAIATAGIMIRPHPKNYAQFAVLDLDDVDNMVVFPSVARTFDATFDVDFFDSLYYSRVVVGINTSAQIEAAIVGRSVCTWQAPDFVHSQDGTIHYQYLAAEDGGLLEVAHSAEEHLGHLSAVFAQPERTEARTRRFVESFVRPNGLGVSATAVFVSRVEAMAGVEPAAAQVPVWAPIARLFMYPIGLALRGQRNRRQLRRLPPRPGWAYVIDALIACYVSLWNGAYNLWYALERIPRSVRRGTRSLMKSVENASKRSRRATRLAARDYRRGRLDLQRSLRRAGRVTVRRTAVAVAAAARPRYIAGSLLRRIGLRRGRPAEGPLSDRVADGSGQGADA